MVRLIEHMSAIRGADAKRLKRKVKQHRKEMSSLLKRILRNLDGLQAPARSGVLIRPVSPQILAQKLDHWPPLTQENLHEFRKGVKELHYMLQLVPDHDGHSMRSYAKVKDTVGDWHDWMELSCLAESVLDPKEEALLLREIRRTSQAKLRAALNVANSLRKSGIEMEHAA
jgi:CHAD domain-containing protein